MYSIEEAAKILKCKEETVRKYIRKGKLHAVKLNGTYSITIRDIINFFKNVKDDDIEDEEIENCVKSRIEALKQG